MRSTRMSTLFQPPIGLRRGDWSNAELAATGENSPLESAGDGRPDFLGVAEREWERGSPSRRNFYDRVGILR